MCRDVPIGKERLKMYSPWQIGQLAEIHREELLKEANQAGLARQALAGHIQHGHVYCRASIWLGRHLVAWGLRLQENHDARIAAHT